MARLPRIKVEGNEAWYHIHSHAAAKTGEYPIESELCRGKLSELIAHYSTPYFCEVAGFNAVGNHYHLILHFEAFRPLSAQEKWDRAMMLYTEKKLKRWKDEDWDRFERRIFNVSELMRNIQGSFATWYNAEFDRKGRFWGDRFKSTLLTDFEAVLECLMYVDLNPLRAGLVKRPEDWFGSSLRLRELGGAASDWLMPLSRILGDGPESTLQHYKARVYYRGAVPTKQGQAVISPEVLAEEKRRGFTKPGAFRRRVECFSHGLAVGDEASVRAQIEALEAAGVFKRKRLPRSQSGIPCTFIHQRRGSETPSN